MAKSKDKFLPFEEARLLARTLGLKTMSDWQRYYKDEVKPNQLPLPILPTNATFSPFLIVTETFSNTKSSPYL